MAVHRRCRGLGAYTGTLPLNHELFQFEDTAELGFGVYRIMKLRRQRFYCAVAR